MEMGLEGRVAVITGSSEGIGLAVATRLASEGARVVICARRPEPLQTAATSIASAGGQVEPILLDVTASDAAEILLSAALTKFKRLDILVNNAGGTMPKPLHKQTVLDWRESFDLNLFSAVNLSLACLPHMRENKWGRIINISSRQAREPDPYFAPYGAAKAGLISFTKCLANGYSKDGISSNCVLPAMVETEGVRGSAKRSSDASGKTPEAVMEEVMRKHPIPAGRLGHPDDVAGLVTFLSSERASWITGSCFTVDGGLIRSAV